MTKTAPPSPGRARLGGLAWTLVRTDFKGRYHGSVGGFAWALLRPLFMFVVLMSVFSFIFASAPAYRLNLIVGLFLWDFFLESTKTGLMSLDAKRYLVTKAPIPSWIVVVTSSSNAAISLAVFVVAIFGYLGLAGRMPGPAQVALFLWYLVLFFAIATGISLASSVLFLEYRDLNQVWDVATQAGFFVAPIIYPLGILPERLHFYLYLWPPTPVIQFSRSVLIDRTVPTLRANLMLVGVAGIILTVGVIVFEMRHARAIERL